MSEDKKSEDKKHPSPVGKVFDFFVGCAQITSTVIGIIALVVSILGLIWVVKNQDTAIQIIRVVSGEPTSTPAIITLPSNTPLPTYTPFPTYTPYPTNLPPTPTIILSSPTPTVDLPFSDNFDDGASSFWKPVVSQGTWRVINGKYTLTGENDFFWSYSLVGDKNWQDYVVEVDYSQENDIYAKLAVVVRAGGSNKLSLALAVNDGNLEWIIWRDGEWQKLVSSTNERYEPGHIRIEVKGNTFIGSASGFDDLVITDTSTTSGQVGLAVWCRFEDSCPIFDNFSVTRIDP